MKSLNFEFEGSMTITHTSCVSVSKSVRGGTTRHMRSSVEELIGMPVNAATEVALFIAVWECLNDLFFEEI